MYELLILTIIMFAIPLYVLNDSLKKQRDYIMKTHKYIHRLKVVAKMQGVDLDDVYDDRED